jgi:hypothetical protein
MGVAKDVAHATAKALAAAKMAITRLMTLPFNWIK